MVNIGRSYKQLEHMHGFHPDHILYHKAVFQYTNGIGLNFTTDDACKLMVLQRIQYYCLYCIASLAHPIPKKERTWYALSAHADHFLGNRGELPCYNSYKHNVITINVQYSFLDNDGVSFQLQLLGMVIFNMSFGPEHV